MTSSNKCAKNVLVLYMYKHGPLRSLHGHGAWRLLFFFWNFQGGDSCTFSQGFRKFSENLRWTFRDEMAGCSHGELYALSSRARHVKTTGSDGIPGLVLLQSATVIAPTLQIIFNTSLRSGYVPESFKLSHVSPLYKSGDKATASNYRPVSLLPIVSRLLETIVKSTLVGYLSALNLLPASQFAYRKNHSTVDALVYAVDRWLSARADHKTTGIVMIDMSKLLTESCTHVYCPSFILSVLGAHLSHGSPVTFRNGNNG